MKRLFSPDAADVAAPPAKKKVKHRTYDADADFSAVASAVSAKWTATPAITLLWTDAATLAQQVTDWKNFYSGSTTGRSKVSAEASALDQLDAKIEEGLSKIKLYLQDKFGKKLALPQYYRYGFIKRSDGYVWVADRDIRITNLALVVAAIVEDGFGSKEYGTTFWTTLQTDYKAALKVAHDNTSATASSIGNKNELKKEIAKTLKSLRRIIEGHYPDTYPNVIREWGWQKETY